MMASRPVQPSRGAPNRRSSASSRNAAVAKSVACPSVQATQRVPNMQKVALWASISVFSVSSACAGSLPQSLIGQWESQRSNCTEQNPTSGYQLIFGRADSVETISFVDHSTEGGSCRITSVSGVGAEIIVSADCRYEESEPFATHILATVDTSGTAMAAIWDDDAAAGERPQVYFRCALDIVGPLDLGIN